MIGRSGIAVEKIDDDFLPDARQELRAELPAGPAFDDANPTGVVAALNGIARLFALLAVPRKPHAHPAQTVGKDMFGSVFCIGAVLADDDGKVRSVDERLDPAARQRQREQRRVRRRTAVPLIVEPVQRDRGKAGMKIVARPRFLSASR